MVACIIYTFAPIVVALNEVGVVKAGPRGAWGMRILEKVDFCAN